MIGKAYTPSMVFWDSYHTRVTQRKKELLSGCEEGVREDEHPNCSDSHYRLQTLVFLKAVFESMRYSVRNGDSESAGMGR